MLVSRGNNLVAGIAKKLEEMRVKRENKEQERSKTWEMRLLAIKPRTFWCLFKVANNKNCISGGYKTATNSY